MFELCEECRYAGRETCAAQEILDTKGPLLPKLVLAGFDMELMHIGRDTHQNPVSLGHLLAGCKVPEAVTAIESLIKPQNSDISE